MGQVPEGEAGAQGRALQSMERRDATRRALLRAAQQLFVARGYRTTAVSDIVRAAGVSQGTFYLYFPSKLGIILALIELGGQRLQETARRFVSEYPDPARAVEGFLFECARFFRANHAFLLVLFREVEQRQATEARQRQNDALCEILAPVIAQGAAAGQFRSDDPHLLSLMLVETAFTLFYHFLLAPEPAIPDGIEERIVSFCLNAITAR